MNWETLTPWLLLTGLTLLTFWLSARFGTSRG